MIKIGDVVKRKEDGTLWSVFYIMNDNKISCQRNAEKLEIKIFTMDDIEIVPDKYAFKVKDYVYVKCYDTQDNEYDLGGNVVNRYCENEMNMYEIKLDANVDKRQTIIVTEPEIYAYIQK